MQNKSASLLIVDDTPANIFTLSKLLSDLYKIKVANNGTDAIKLAKKSQPDLILLDILMPGLNGIDTCKALKADPQTAGIPVIFVTARNAPEDEAQGLSVGAVDYITKPFNQIVVRARVSNHLRLKTLNDNLKEEVDKEVKKRLQTQEKLEAQEMMMHQQSKLAAMGEMIGAIAHQWRQPLNALHMRIQNLEDDFEDGLVDEAFIESFIKKNQETIMFMSDTIDDFRNFFRKDKDKVVFSALQALEETLRLLKGQMDSHKIEVTIQGDDFELNTYRREFQQVLLNIINNAKDAFLENNLDNRKIFITFCNKSIEVCDNAGGIPKDLLPRIFEPYFTTKEESKGTGIGLYMSKLIIESNMGGSLQVQNRSDGACFSLDFTKVD